MQKLVEKAREIVYKVYKDTDNNCVGLDEFIREQQVEFIAQALADERRSAELERDDVLATLKEVCEKIHLKEGSPNYDLIKKGLSKCADYNFGGWSHPLSPRSEG